MVPEWRYGFRTVTDIFIDVRIVTRTSRENYLANIDINLKMNEIRRIALTRLGKVRLTMRDLIVSVVEITDCSVLCVWFKFFSTQDSDCTVVPLVNSVSAIPYIMTKKCIRFEGLFRMLLPLSIPLFDDLIFNC